MDGTDNMKNQIEDHDCGTPQGDGCQVCADQFNQIMNGPKVVYKESDKTKEEILQDINWYLDQIKKTIEWKDTIPDQYMLIQVSNIQNLIDQL